MRNDEINIGERIIDKLKEMDKRLMSIDTTLVKQEGNLAEHMRRTDLLEKRVEKSDSKLSKINYVFVAAAGALSVHYWAVVKEFLRFLL